jgi:hypothetical protein
MMGRKWLLAARIAAAALAVLVAAGWGSAPAAHATTQLFGISSGGLYWNDWSGTGAVRMYRGGATNEEFYEERVYMCGGSDIVRAGCPNGWAPANSYLAGAIIVQVVYAPTGQCVGSVSSGIAWLTACNDTANGKYGGIGTLQELWQPAGCSGSSGYLYNRYAIGQDRALRGMESGGGSDTPLVTDGESVSCWAPNL